MLRYLLCFACILFVLVSFSRHRARAWQSDHGNGTFNNPVLYADYPDPLANPGFTVQSRTNLTTGDWVNVTSPAPQIAGQQWQVTLPSSTDDAAFYWLTK